VIVAVNVVGSVTTHALKVRVPLPYHRTLLSPLRTHLCT